MPKSKTPEDPAEKEKRRERNLVKNRLSAATSRQRTIKRYADMDAEISLLRSKNVALEAQAAMIPQYQAEIWLLERPGLSADEALKAQVESGLAREATQQLAIDKLILENTELGDKLRRSEHLRADEFKERHTRMTKGH